MAKYKCPCCEYFAHTSGSIPNPNEWRLVSDSYLCDAEETIETEKVFKESTPLYKCVGCDAVVIFWNKDFDNPKWYKPEFDENT